MCPIPLAETLRPHSLDEFFGQAHLLDNDAPLARTLASGQMHSFILWGPPGCGKTTLARMVAGTTALPFYELSAAVAGSSDIRAVAKESANETVILFIDEIHRFNKNQQDVLLPLIEKGVLYCVGATTENPSFALNNALLSRMQVYTLRLLDTQAIIGIIERAVAHCNDVALDTQVCGLIASTSAGDARKALNIYQLLRESCPPEQPLDKNYAEQHLPRALAQSDNKGDTFYELISALHKSIRTSDVDASLYWLCRMLQGGITPLYIARRLVRIASEDIGNADPRALELTLHAWETQEKLGNPEGELALAQAVIYLAVAAKSNAVYTAFKKAQALASQYPQAPVPLAMRNAPTKFHKSLDYGATYRYDHDYEDAITTNDCLPEIVYKALDAPLYTPSKRGLENKIAEKLRWITERKK